ncbi:putative membrane protein [Belliella baltica DSM 15883]|uniref:Putative membrane protein n=1 Tax=Belliella baltica (strain DSM 15883 / CIP 108006 / LMG 21964 / BA134) TaxID=866536 RepID=I3Z896_BELBD|nr:rhomboid family intramembrane serine protease [Belliella baltica]AFL85464.1 putative membrane protein [Belliella baltica DSM 15883]
MKIKNRKYVKNIRESLVVSSRLSLLMILVFLLEVSFNIRLNFLGIFPLSLIHLPGIIFSPFLHGNHIHLITNLLPFFVLTTMLYFFYDHIANQVFLSCLLITNSIVWLAARPYIHIGASGLIYGLVFFMIFLGLFKGTYKTLAISAFILLFYGSIFYGVVPGSGRVSWESHLAGACVGVVTAFWMSRKV